MNKIFSFKNLIIFLSIVIIIGAVVFFHMRKLEKERENQVSSDLRKLRTAITLYYQNNNGTYPRELSLSSPFGKYIEKIPTVPKLRPRGKGATTPAGSQVSYGIKSPEGYGKGWYYNYETGDIFINSTGLDSENKPYSDY